MSWFALSGSLGELPFYVGALAIVGSLGYATVKTVVKQWRATKESEHLAILKQQMLDRGMSAEDIAKVVSAGAAKPDHKM